MIQYDPNGIFEQNPSKGGVCEIKSAFARSLVAWADASLIAAVPGKKIRVVSFAVSQWNSAANGMFFSSKPSGVGVQIYPQISLPAANSQEIQGLNWAGWFETVAGEGLTVSSLLAGIDVQVRYIEYTP